MKNQTMITLILALTISCTSLPKNESVPFTQESKCVGGIVMIVGNERVETKCHPNGQTRTEARYKKNKNEKWVPNGIVRTWYASGEPRGILKYVMGVPDGEWETYYENGQQYSKQIYDNGKTVGIWKRWYENGQLCDYSEFFKLDGKTIVKHAVYHDNGQLSEQGHWVQVIEENGEFRNVKDGEWLQYDREGKLINSKIFHDGVIEPKS